MRQNQMSEEAKPNGGTALVKVSEQALVAPETTEAARSLLEVISRAVRDPAIDVGKMERLLVMHEKIVEDQRRAEFMAAMSRLQAKLPQIRKDGRIVVKGVERSRYARIEDIDVAIRPLLAEEGFAFSFDSKSLDGQNFIISCKLSHRDGHSETKELPLPLDRSDFRSNVQSVKSTLSYARRCLIEMHLNLIERGADDDGSGGARPITAEQAKKLTGELTVLKVDRAKFLAYMGADKLESILSHDLPKALNALETRRQIAKST